MKKSLLILTLVLVFTLAMSSFAMAALQKDPAAKLGDGKADYLKPTTPYVPVDANGMAKTIHSAYQKNTDACASCHATHTAVGPALLQWSSNAAACDACHDGSVTTTYDVNAGKIANVDTTVVMTYGGLFGAYGADDKDGNAASLSKHNVTRGSDTIVTPVSGAPGGKATTGADGNGAWGDRFECTSCHDPHGALGNYRILNPNANDIGVVKKVVGEVLTASTDGLTFSAAKGGWLLDHANAAKIVVEAADGTVTDVSRTVQKDPVNGKVKFASPPAGTVKADYAPGVIVRGTVTNKLLSNESVSYTSGMNNFCGTCHTDYNANAANSPQTTLLGQYTEAYRHPVGYSYNKKPGVTVESGFVTCLTCHVAHGTNTTWWGFWAKQDKWTGTVTTEDAGGSALKRLPNMSTCEACHDKGGKSKVNYVLN